jgi:hypothetical protein
MDGGRQMARMTRGLLVATAAMVFGMAGTSASAQSTAFDQQAQAAQDQYGGGGVLPDTSGNTGTTGTTASSVGTTGTTSTTGTTTGGGGVGPDSGGGAPNPNTTVATSADKGLPFTGVDLTLLVLLGAGLVGVGAMIRVAQRVKPSSHS